MSTDVAGRSKHCPPVALWRVDVLNFLQLIDRKRVAKHKSVVSVGPTGFEPAISTPPVLEQVIKGTVNCGTKHDAREALHQWLHLIAQSEQRDANQILIELLIDSLEPQTIERLLHRLQRCADAIAESSSQRK